MATTFKNPLDAKKSLTEAFKPTNQAQTDAIATASALVPNNNIPVSEIKPEAPMNLGNIDTDTTNYSQIIGGVGDSIANEFSNYNKQQEQAKKEQKEAGSDITDVMLALTGETGALQAAQEKTGVSEARAGIEKYGQTMADLQAQASMLMREAEAIPLQIQERFKGTGATDRGVEPIQTAALRRNAIKALSIAQQSDIASAALTGSQARLDSALQKAQEIVDLTYRPLEQELAIRQQQYELNKDVLESIDKKRAESLGIALNKESARVAEEKADSKESQKMLMNAIQGQAPQSVISKAQDILDKGGSSIEVAQALGSYSLTVSEKLDNAYKRAQINKLGREISLLGEPSAAEIKATKAALLEAKASIPVMVDKIDAVDALLDNAGLKFRVGTTRRNRQGIFIGVGSAGLGQSIPSKISEVQGEGQAFAGGIHKLISGLSLQALIDAKSRGATFGALSDAELRILSNSASAINDWEIRDKNGVGTGRWAIDEPSFRAELEQIKTLTRRALVRSGENLVTADEDATLDSIYIQNNQALSAEDYY